MLNSIKSTSSFEKFGRLIRNCCSIAIGDSVCKDDSPFIVGVVDSVIFLVSSLGSGVAGWCFDGGDCCCNGDACC